MTSFEYVMVLVSIIVGLGVTHVLTAASVAVHRLRGHGEPIRLDVTYLAWVGFVFIWLVSFWWWEFRLSAVIEQWTFGLYLFILGYAITLFLLANVLVPRDLEGVGDSRAYFLSIRKPFFVLFVFANLVDLADSFLKGFEWGTRPAYVVFFLASTIGGVIGILSSRPRLQAAIAVLLLIGQLVFTFRDIAAI